MKQSPFWFSLIFKFQNITPFQLLKQTSVSLWRVFEMSPSPRMTSIMATTYKTYVGCSFWGQTCSKHCCMFTGHRSLSIHDVKQDLNTIMVTISICTAPFRHEVYTAQLQMAEHGSWAESGSSMKHEFLWFKNWSERFQVRMAWGPDCVDLRRWVPTQRFLPNKSK